MGICGSLHLLFAMFVQYAMHVRQSADVNGKPHQRTQTYSVNINKIYYCVYHIKFRDLISLSFKSHPSRAPCCDYVLV